MSTNIATINDAGIVSVLQSSLYPGASPESIGMVLAYCKAAGLDPLQKPVHIVPMWDGKARQMRDVVMQGIGLYRIQAARTGEYAGVTEPEFGPDVTETIGGAEITYPQWCRVTVKRRCGDHMADFTAREYWRENYAVKGGQEKSIAPNAMWMKRPYAQLAKCAESQALRKAFPELGAQPTAEEMEGKVIDHIDDMPGIDISPAIDRLIGCQTMSDLQAEFADEWTQYPQARKELTAAKDTRKAELIREEISNDAA